MQEKILQSLVCKRCPSEYKIFEGDKELLDKISPIINGEKIDLHFPRICPACRQRRRFTWRNERRFYRIKCGKCGKGTISVYHPDININIYCQDCCYSDENSCQVDYDKTLGFFENFKKLFDTDVMLNLQNAPTLENSLRIISGIPKTFILVVLCLK